MIIPGLSLLLLLFLTNNKQLNKTLYQLYITQITQTLRFLYISLLFCTIQQCFDRVVGHEMTRLTPTVRRCQTYIHYLFYSYHTTVTQTEIQILYFDTRI